MRIVAGRHRGRVLVPPPGRTARPTADRTREALFNILTHGEGIDLDGAAVVDAFAGTGALGLEALSRGAAHVTFIDNHPAALKVIAANAESLGETAQVTLLARDACNPPPAPRPCSLALLDPPYGSGLAGPCLTALAAAGWLTAGAVCVVEVAAKEDVAAPEGFEATDQRSYGAAKLVFLRRA